MGAHANDTLTIVALALGFVACCAVVRRTSNRGPIALDEEGTRYKLMVATTPEHEKVVVAEAI